MNKTEECDRTRYKGMKEHRIKLKVEKMNGHMEKRREKFARQLTDQSCQCCCP